MVHPVKIWVLILSALFLSCKSTPENRTAAHDPISQPNIIIILTDDLGYVDVGFNGSRDILTPNIDKIAEQGAVCTKAYVSHPYCSPSRAGIMTGRYQQRFGHEHNVPFLPEDSLMGTPTSEIFLSQKMKQAGYRTCAIGKWHLGDHPGFLPHNRGFDHWFGFSGGNMNYWGHPHFKDGKMNVQRNDDIVSASELTYLTDDFTNEALSYIQDNKEEPFFLYLAYNAPHSPDHTTKNYLKKTEHVEYGLRSVYGAMIAGVDAGVGKIDALLSDLGIRENTMIIFLSDNGGRLDASNNGQFRGHKGMLFEGGIRVPFVLSWPSRIPHGICYEKPVTALDIFSTCIAAAGIDESDDQALDGVNLLPYIDGTNPGIPHEELYWRVAGGEEYAIRRGNYKLIKSAYKGKTMLFDLSKDEMELHDISGQKPALYSELQALYETWNSSLEDPRWTDPHIENVMQEENDLQEIRKKSLSKKEK